MFFRARHAAATLAARAGRTSTTSTRSRSMGGASVTFILTRECPASPRVSAFDEILPASSSRPVALPVRPRRPVLAGADGPALPVHPGLDHQPRERSLPLRLVRAVARRVLAWRQDWFHGRPDGADGGRLRHPGGRAHPDDAA